MALGGIIGALRVVIGADSAALEKNLDSARGNVANFGKGIALASAAASTAITTFATGMALAVRNSITEADKLGKMAQSIGIPVEQLSALRLAAALSDVSMESLGKSVGKLSKAMVEAGAKPTSDAANAFKALGVSVVDSDGKLKSSEQVLTDIAGRFENLKDGAGKTAVSMAIFGRAGADMIPLLNSGKEGLKGMIDEAQRLGLVIDNDTAKSAEAFNDNLTRMRMAKQAVIEKITAGMIPALEVLSQQFVKSAQDAEGWKAVGETIGQSILGLVNKIELVRVNIQRWGVEWTALRELMSTDIFSGKVLENWEKFRAAGRETERVIENLKITQETAGLADAFGATGNKAAASAKQLQDFNYQAMAGKNALDSFLASQAKTLAGQQAELQTIGLAAGAKEQLRVQLQALQIATENQIPITEALRLKIAETALAAGDMALKLQGAQLIQQNLEPLQAYTIELQNSTAAMVAANATQEQLAANAERVAEKFGMSSTQIGANVANTMGSLSQLTGTFAKENKAMGVASKAFGIGQAIINTQIAITKALATLPPPASYAAVAFAVAQGAASVAAIAAQKFKSGADFIVPGGIGGGDRVPLNAMLEPGERVRVEPNRYGETGAGSGGSRVIEVRGLDPNRLWTGDMVRSFAEALGREVGDGLQLRLSPS